MLHLDESLLIGSGGRRAVYRHPERADLCVKVVLPGAKPQRRRSDGVRRLVRPGATFDENDIDARAYARLERRRRPGSPYPRCFGFVATDRGRGLVVELIRDADGAVATSLEAWLQRRGASRALAAALDDLLARMLADGSPTRTPTPANVVVRRGEGGRLGLHVVDGFGNSEFLPVSDLLRAAARRKIRRRHSRFLDQIAARWPAMAPLLEGAAPGGAGVSPAFG